MPIAHAHPRGTHVKDPQMATRPFDDVGRRRVSKNEDPSPFSRSDSSSDPLTRHEQIALAAYRRAEERGFEPGHEMEDWLSAEREIDSRAGQV
jgi:hypothetical protein